MFGFRVLGFRVEVLAQVPDEATAQDRRVLGKRYEQLPAVAESC